MKIYKVSTWYDTISTESAEHGEYESTGNEYLENTWDTFEDAVKAALAHVNGLDNAKDFAEFEKKKSGDVVLYSSDASTDYSSGDEYYYTACIKVIETGKRKLNNA